MKIKYKTIKTTKILSDIALNKLGVEGWTLGGVGRSATSIKFPTHYYHFWKAVKGRARAVSASLGTGNPARPYKEGKYAEGAKKFSAKIRW